MEMILQNPYYLVSGIAGIAAVGFILAAVIFLFADRKKQKSKALEEKEEEEKAYTREQLRVMHSHPSKETPDPETEEELKQRIIETYQRSAGLRETMETLADTYQGAFAGNIKNARRYLTESRYKDYENGNCEASKDRSKKVRIWYEVQKLCCPVRENSVDFECNGDCR